MRIENMERTHKVSILFYHLCLSFHVILLRGRSAAVDFMLIRLKNFPELNILTFAVIVEGMLGEKRHMKNGWKQTDGGICCLSPHQSPGVLP